MKTTRKSQNLAAALQSFFGNYLPRLKNSSLHTIHSYRDSLKLLLLFMVKDSGAVERLSIEDINVDAILVFLDFLEKERKNSIGTRNNRLAAIHCFFRHVATVAPEHIQLSQQVLSIPFKNTCTRNIDYLEFEEIQAVLKQIDRLKPNGRRDYALLTLMFNTGARAQEIVDLKASDLHLLPPPPSIRIFGKGRKERICPIWPGTAQLLREYVEERGIDMRTPTCVFTNHIGTPLSRFGIRYVLAKYIQKAKPYHRSLEEKRLHPHSMRHSTAVHLLKAGVDLVSIANWLGHTSVNTTNKYVTIDLEMKREAIAKASRPCSESALSSAWRKDPDILSWLEAL